MESKLTLFKKWKILFVFLALICCSNVVDASHFRGGTISSTCGTGNEVTYTITTSWRASFFGTNGVGQTVSSLFGFRLGDGTTVTVGGTSTFYNAAEDWATYTSTVTHTYSSPGTYTAFFSACCRLGSLPNGWADDSYRLESTVEAGPSCNQAPTLATPAFINVIPGNLQTCFQLNANDPEGDPVSWSLATTAETGLSPSPDAVWPAGTLSLTGQICVNPTTMPGAPAGGYTDGTLIPIAIKVSDDNGNGTIPGDILFKVASSAGVAPIWDYANTPADGSTLTFFAGSASSYGFEAEDADASNMVSILPSGIPSGASFSPGLPNASNPNSTTLSWTPTVADAGTYPVTLIAEDNTGLQTQTSFSIEVLTCVAPVASCVDVTIGLDASGAAVLNPSTVGGSSTASCGLASETVTPNTFDCADHGSTVTVTYTIEDINGATDICTADVTIMDMIAPDPVCDQNASTTLDINGLRTVLASQMDAGSDDNCTAHADLRFSYSATDVNDTERVYDCDDLGFNPVSIWVWDLAGNVSTECEAVLFVADNTAPDCQANPAINVVLNHEGEATITVADIDDGTTDACGVEFLTIDIDEFDCDDIANNPIVVTMTAIDSSGNTSTCTTDVTVQDLAHIHVHTRDTLLTLDMAGMVTVNADDIIRPGTLYDNCGIADTVVSPNMLDCSNIGSPTIVTLTVTDVNGNTLTATAEVSVQDITPPTASCADVTINLDATGTATVVAADLDGSSSDACGIDPAGYSIDISTFDCTFDGTAQTVELTVTDVNGNTATCTSNVTIDDAIDPVAVCQDITVDLDAAGSVTVIGTDVDGGSSDNCSYSVTSADATYGCADVGANTYSLVIDDGSGQTATCDATVTVRDITPPTMSCQDITVTLDGAGMGTIAPADVDAGSSDACSIVSLSVGPTEVGCDPTDFSEFTYLGDYNGHSYYESNNQFNFADAIADAEEHGGIVAAIEDAGENAIAEMASGSSWLGFNDIMIEGMFVWQSGEPVTYTNWLGGEPNNLGNEDATIINFGGTGLWNDVPVLNLYTYVLEVATTGTNEVSVVLNAEDANGNTASCVSIATIVDDTPPVPMCKNIVVQLDNMGVASIDSNAIENGSTDACGVAMVDVDVNSFDCTNVGANAVIMTVTDVNGNTSTCTANVQVEDNVDPDCVAMDITVVLDQLGNYTVNAQDIDDGSSDACGIASYEIRRASPFSGSPPFQSSINVGCFDTGGPVAVELRITDNNGNSSICSANVTVLDETSPFMNCQDNIVVSLNSDGEGALIGINLLAWWGIFDACGIDNITVDGNPIELYDCSDVGFFDVLVRAEDNNGNATECTVEIEVRDQEAPDCMVMDSTIYLDVNGVAALDSADLDDGSDDNCGIASIDLDIKSFGCTDVDNPVTVTQTVVDVNGNSSTCTATVTVLDTINPICATMDITVQLDAAGVASIDSNAVDDGSSDACGIASIETDIRNFSCADVGSPITVTQTVTDVNGNVSTCTAVVTVEDNVAPTAICQNVVVMLDASGNGILDHNDLDNGSNDACGIIPVTASQTSFDCTEVGDNTVTLTVTDVNGNVSTCDGIVTVVDNVLPTATCADITVQLDASGSATVLAGDIDGGSSDNCGVASLCIGKGVETSSLAGTLDLSDPTFNYDSGINTCIADPSIFTGCCLMVEGAHHYDQQQFSVDMADTYTFTLNDVNGNTDFTGIIYDASFNPLDICQNIIVGDDDSNSGGVLDPQIELVVTVPPGDYILVTSTFGVGDDDFPAPYTWDITSLAGGTLSAFECLPSIDYDCSEEGDNTATLCVTDVNGNVSYCSATVTVEDNVDPTALCQDVTVQLDALGSGILTAAEVDNGSNDACGIDNISIDNDAFTCADLGSGNTVTLTVEDVNGNTSTCTATVTVEDNVAPVAMCQDITVQLDMNGDGSLVASDLNDGSTDACGPLSYSADITTFDCSNVGPNTVVLNVTDGSGNSSTCTSTVTVEDNVDPTAVCQDITVQLDFNGDVTITGAMIDGGSSDACGIASLDAGAGTVDLGCADVGPNTITLTVTDVNNNTATCDAIVTVEDNVAPLVNCVNNVEVPLNTDGIGFVTKEEVTGATFDACGIVDTFIIRNDDMLHPDYGIENEMLFFDCSDIGLVDVIIRVYDANGNVEECQTAVNVKDEILPTMECTSATIYLDVNGVAALDSNALDNGSYDNCAIVEFSVSQTDFDCAHLGMNLITMTAEDQSGNTSSCANGVMVLDTFAPVAMCQDITVQLDASGAATIAGAMLDNGSTDACGPLTFSADMTAFDCSHIGANTVTMTVTDGSGNSSTCTSTVTIEDNVAPTADCMDITIQLDASGVASIDSNAVNGSSSDACGIASFATDLTDFDCSHVGPNTVTLTVLDNNGNMNTCTATVTVEDVTGPDCATQDITVQLDATGNVSITAAMIDDNSSDSCGIASMSVSPDAFTCAEVGANTVTLTLTDVNGNMSTCTAEVTVEDVTGPDCATQDITVQLDATGNVSITAAMIDDDSYDACGIASMSVSPDAFTCAEVGANTVTLTLTDVNGNMSTCTAEVTVEDVTGPDCATQDITVQLDAMGNASITAAMIDDNSFDACGIASMSVSPDAFTCAEVGANTVTLTLTDMNGNVSTCTAQVTVEDSVDPIADCMDITIQLDASGIASIDSNAVNGNSSDACGIASFATDMTDFDCSHIGANTVTLTVEDNNGNTSTCTATVTVEDVTGPSLTCPADIIVNTLPSDCNQNVIMPTLAPMDVCSGLATYEYQAVDITFISTGVDTFALFPVGLTAVTAIATDAYGNTSTCSFNVEVIDNIDPVIGGCDDIGPITMSAEAGLCGATVTWDESFIVANDNCSGQGTGLTVTSDMESGDFFPVGVTTVTYTATDNSGNTATCTFDVTINSNDAIAEYSYNAASLDVLFADASTNAVSWDWDFGDSNTSTDQNPLHSYATGGTYNVCLTATGACGDTDIYCENITVSDVGMLCIDQVNIENGWSLVSFDVQPADSTIANVFGSALGTSITMITTFDGTAKVYDPAVPVPALNTLQTIERGLGYWVQSNADLTLTVTGECLDPDFKRDLTEGWNLISYLPVAQQTPAMYFTDVIALNALEQVTTFRPSTGTEVYDPSVPVPFLNTLQMMDNGYGYWVKVSQDVSAPDWAQAPEEASSRSDKTDDWGNALTSTHDFITGTVEGLSDGEIIDVLDAEDNLVIQLVVTQGEYLMTTPLYGDDKLTADIDGLLIADELFFEYNGIRADASINFVGNRVMHFVDLEFESETTSIEEIDADAVSFYPNPFHTQATVAIDIAGTGGTYELGMMDATGRLVWKRSLGQLSAGQHQFNITRDGLTPGQYNLIVRNTDQNTLQRLPIIVIE